MPEPRAAPQRRLPGRRPGHGRVEHGHHLQGVAVELAQRERAQVAPHGQEGAPELADAATLGEDVLGDVVFERVLPEPRKVEE
eukprot:2015102-Alexandrium_andersonii.AAC.1